MKYKIGDIVRWNDSNIYDLILGYKNERYYHVTIYLNYRKELMCFYDTSFLVMDKHTTLYSNKN